MNEKKEDPFGMTSLVDTWIKSMGDVFGNMASQWAGHGPQQGWSMAGKSANPKAQATMDATLKNWVLS